MKTWKYSTLWAEGRARQTCPVSVRSWLFPEAVPFPFCLRTSPYVLFLSGILSSIQASFKNNLCHLIMQSQRDQNLHYCFCWFQWTFKLRGLIKSARSRLNIRTYREQEYEMISIVLPDTTHAGTNQYSRETMGTVLNGEAGIIFYLLFLFQNMGYKVYLPSMTVSGRENAVWRQRSHMNDPIR